MLRCRALWFISVLTLLWGIGAAASARAQASGPTFDVVSIKRNAANVAGTLVIGPPVNQQRPDGGFTMTNISVGQLISLAYPPAPPRDMVGLPAWTMSERYDVSATSSLSSATPDDRIAMMRAMLADRFKLAAHFEKRERQVLDLVLARSDRRLGSGLTPLDVDCARINASRPPLQRQDRNAPPPPCVMRSIGDRMEGEGTIAGLVSMLVLAGMGNVVDKTGLPGSYRVTLDFDSAAARRGPGAQTTSTAPSIFTALQEQLGLKLESSRAEIDALVIDRLERPTEN